MAQSIPMQQTTVGGAYILGSDRDRARQMLGTVIQTPDGQWWEVTEIKAWRNNTITVDYLGYGKKVSAKYAALNQQIECLKREYLRAQLEKSRGMAAFDYAAGAPMRATIERVKAELAALDPKRVAKVMPGVEIK